MKLPEETFALLKIIELGNRQIAEGKMIPLAEVKRRIRARRAQTIKSKRSPKTK
jgi:hypothetical protein